MKPFSSSAVADVFNAYPEEMKQKLMFLRQLIFDTAQATDGVGELEETLKWGEPAYLTTQTKSGSLIRIDHKKSSERQYAMYFLCQTNLVDTFRSMFPDTFSYDGNRRIVFDQDDRVPVEELRFCIAMALTYHRRKKAKHVRF